MSELNINCSCKNNFKKTIDTGSFKCPKCKTTFARVFNAKAETYEIIFNYDEKTGKEKC